MLFMKIMSLLWPFIKEVVLGEKTVLETFKTNKKKLFGIALIIASIGLNYFAVSKVIVVSREYITLMKKYKALESSKQSPITNGLEVRQEIPSAPTAPMPDVKKPELTAEDQRHARLRARLNAIKEREEKNE
jgi:hypothetical protein